MRRMPTSTFTTHVSELEITVSRCGKGHSECELIKEDRVPRNGSSEEETNASSQIGVTRPMAVTPTAQPAIHNPEAAVFLMPLMQTLSARAMGTKGVEHGHVSHVKEPKT